MTITLRYVALLRDERGLAGESVQKAPGHSVRDLYRDLRRQHGFSLDEAQLLVAVNDEFSTWDTVLGDGDLVVFLPPVAGG